MSQITLDHITKRFPGGTIAVKDASFTIESGELFILLGPSGCGKSTLLNMIVGLETVTEGEIRVDGERVNELDPKERNMAMVFQSYAIYPHMTVEENLAFPLKLAGIAKEEIKKRVEETAAILELETFLNRMPKSLSGGQRQRVAMGRAIVRKPEVFLLDEPLSNLDAKLRVQMRTEIGRLQRELGTTMIYVTHDQTEAMTLGDRLVLLRQGVIQQIGTPRDLYTRPANLFTAGFIGSPAMNFLPARLEDDRLLLPMGEIPFHHKFDSSQQSRPLVAGIRPESFSLATDENDPSVFTTEITLVEWLGAEVFVHFDIKADQHSTGGLPAGLAEEKSRPGTFSLIARLDGAGDLGRGDTIRLAIDTDRIHLFDKETGDSLA